MSKTKFLPANAIAAACLCWPLLAAEQKKGAEELVNPPPQPYSERETKADRFQRLGHPEKASSLIGMQVQNLQNEKLGKVDDLAVDLESGRIVQVILSTGGLLGIGDKTVAVPPGAFQCDSANKVIQLDADKEKLKAAPKFEISKWAECCEPSHVAEIYRYYGQEPYFGATSAPYGKTGQLQNRSGELAKSSETPVNSPVGRIGYVEKASKVIGMPVKNLQDERIGKVDNLVVDLPEGRIVAVVLASGGFLGLGDELSAAPPNALHFNQDREAFALDATKETLLQAPHFSANQWPNMGEPAYVERIYRVYQVEPYFSGKTTDADNTRRNFRDRHNQTLTPLDQSNSAPDIETTARIRKDILAEKGMSRDARNVKIITVHGHVTLRGTVKTEEEKRRIEEIAARNGMVAKVDNQLEVKGDPINN